jgi:hypothetical protein
MADQSLPLLKHKGARSELVACAWLLCQGYEVFRNVSQHGLMDIIAIKDGEREVPGSNADLW